MCTPTITRPWAAYLAFSAVAIAAYFVVPSDDVKTTLYGLLGLSSAAVTVPASSITWIVPAVVSMRTRMIWRSVSAFW